jgi:RNA polymerase sigma-70 factor (ECF subfamily)
MSSGIMNRGARISFVFVVNSINHNRKMKGTKQLLWMSNIIETKKQPIAVIDDDMEYVVCCQRGDTEAFAVLVERHQKKMLNIAFRMTGDYDDACDIVQDAFLAAFRAIKKFKGEAQFSTWLYRIVVNYTKNRLKQVQSLKHREQPTIDDFSAEGRALCQLRAAEKSPDEQMVQQERDASVQQCISGLDNEYREVLVLRDIQGFSYEEIRDVLQIPGGTVKSRLSRARLALKDCLTKIIGDW